MNGMFILLIWKLPLKDHSVPYAKPLHFTVARRFSAGQWHVTTSLALGNEWQLYAPQCGSWATDFDPNGCHYFFRLIMATWCKFSMAEVGNTANLFWEYMSVAELREDANGQKGADCLKLSLSLCVLRQGIHAIAQRCKFLAAGKTVGRCWKLLDPVV